MNLAMFGGSFNPVHNGHVELTKSMISHFNLDRVFIIPTNITPLKDNSVMVSAFHRFEMCKLAFSGISQVEVSDREILREGKSYTVDTLSELKSEFSKAKIHLIVGADAFIQLPQWYKASEIFSLAKIITIARNNTYAEHLNEVGESYKKIYDADYAVIKNPVTNISSTEIRERIFNHNSVKGLIPDSVYNFIKENEIYGYKNQSSL